MPPPSPPPNVLAEAEFFKFQPTLVTIETGMNYRVGSRENVLLLWAVLLEKNSACATLRLQLHLTVYKCFFHVNLFLCPPPIFSEGGSREKQC
jgi:hypothetical protein